MDGVSDFLLADVFAHLHVTVAAQAPVHRYDFCSRQGGWETLRRMRPRRGHVLYDTLLLPNIVMKHAQLLLQQSLLCVPALVYTPPAAEKQQASWATHGGRGTSLCSDTSHCHSLALWQACAPHDSTATLLTSAAAATTTALHPACDCLCTAALLHPCSCCMCS